MRAGLALPQWDYSVAGETPLAWSSVREYAELGERCGFDSMWVCDHLFLSIAKYGGRVEPYDGFEPVVTLGALARVTTRARLGTMVFCEALRPASVLAKALASLDVVMDGRLEVGLGAGWYAAEYPPIGMEMPSHRERIARLRDAITVCRGMLGGGPYTHDGEYHSAHDAPNEPAARQRPRPPITVGGSGDRLLRVVAELADGWNTCWRWTTDDYAARVQALERACDQVGRDPTTVDRSVGLYSLCGETEADLAQRFERLRQRTPAGLLDGMTVDDWRVGRLVGTVEQVAEQVAAWEELGVGTLVLGVGAAPFQVTAPDDVELLAHAVGLGAGEPVP